MTFSDGPDGPSGFASADKLPQRHHDDHRHQQGKDLDVTHRNAGDTVDHWIHGFRERLVFATKNRDCNVLHDQGRTDGADQRCQRILAADRTHSDQCDDDADDTRAEHGKDDCQIDIDT